MELLTSNQIVKKIKNIIHEDTQLHVSNIDLTIDTIYEFSGAGSLDFGGSEFEAAETAVISPQKKNEEDDYGWWNLESGRYKAEFNEQLSAGKGSLCFVSPHNHTRQAGIITDSVIATGNGSLNVIFDVPSVGCNIKENARFATVHLFRN